MINLLKDKNIWDEEEYNKIIKKNTVEEVNKPVNQMYTVIHHNNQDTESYSYEYISQYSYDRCNVPKSFYKDYDDLYEAIWKKDTKKIIV